MGYPGSYVEDDLVRVKRGSDYIMNECPAENNQKLNVIIDSTFIRTEYYWIFPIHSSI